MPAMLDDPDAPTVYRTSGASPFPDPDHASLPSEIVPRQVTLRDRVTVATIVPFTSQHQVPASLIKYLNDQLNAEIEQGDTYPMITGMSAEKFGSYWFQNFAAIIFLGSIERVEDLLEERDWATECLGTFYVKPNYPGRSSHVCNAGFIVTTAARNRGVGRLLGEQYVEWAPKLGYTYSVFNLVYETNVASCRIWDGLGFKRIGRVPGCGNLKSYPDRLIDAIIYGRDLSLSNSEIVSEERFDKIKMYLKTGHYPHGADRAEKSRLRSAAAHYKLLPGLGPLEDEKLMLKDKEVISDPQKQYEIASRTHLVQHGGINKTTTAIAEKYHWTRIKETVSLVIRNCGECKDIGKPTLVRVDSTAAKRATHPHLAGSQTMMHASMNISTTPQSLTLRSTSEPHTPEHFDDPFHDPSLHLHPTSAAPQVLSHSLHSPSADDSHHLQQHHYHTSPMHPHRLHPQHMSAPSPQDYIDPQIMEDVRSHLHGYPGHDHAHTHTHGHDHEHEPSAFTAAAQTNRHHDHNHIDDVHVHDDPFSYDHTQTHPHSHGHDDTENDGDLDMLLDDDDEDDVNPSDHATDQIHKLTNEELDAAKMRAQTAARAAEAAMRADEMKDDGGGPVWS